MNNKSETKKQRPAKRTQKEQLKAKRTTSAGTVSGSAGTGDARSVFGITLNADTARTAVVLSEIIGPPKSRRRGRR